MALAIASAIGVLLVAVPSVSAQGGCGGSGCLPGSGYTFDRYWNCGAFYSFQACWYPGVLGEPNNYHSWGWGSADYDGGGSVRVIIDSYSKQSMWNYFYGEGTNLARACFFPSCNDQDRDSLMSIRVDHGYGGDTRHTIYGHGKA